MSYRKLYSTLSQQELRNVAARARLSIEDVRQEALLRCWQIASGQSDYQPCLGTVRQYVMAKLWGLAVRETELRTVTLDCTGDDDGEFGPRARRTSAQGASPSVLDALIARDEQDDVDRRLEAAQRGAQRRYAGVSSTVVLMDQGISSGRIASLTGVTPQAVRQRVARERVRGRRGTRSPEET